MSAKEVTTCSSVAAYTPFLSMAEEYGVIVETDADMVRISRFGSYTLKNKGCKYLIKALKTLVKNAII